MPKWQQPAHRWNNNSSNNSNSSSSNNNTTTKYIHTKLCVRICKGKIQIIQQIILCSTCKMNISYNFSAQFVDGFTMIDPVLWFIFHPFEQHTKTTGFHSETVPHVRKSNTTFAQKFDKIQDRDREKKNLHRKTLTQPTTHGKLNKHTDKYFPCPNILCHFFILCNSIFLCLTLFDFIYISSRCFLLYFCSMKRYLLCAAVFFFYLLLTTSERAKFNKMMKERNELF